jgi:small basic protein (TIGR04137 family)
MSIDKSLRSKDQLKRQRNVLKRAERIEELAKKKEWQEGDSVFALPKVKVAVRRKKPKAKEEVKEEVPAEAAAEAVEGEEKEAAPEKKEAKKKE